MKNEKWKMKNEKWKVKNEKWKMKKWKMKSEKWSLRIVLVLYARFPSRVWYWKGQKRVSRLATTLFALTARPSPSALPRPPRRWCSLDNCVENNNGKCPSIQWVMGYWRGAICCGQSALDGRSWSWTRTNNNIEIVREIKLIIRNSKRD